MATVLIIDDSPHIGSMLQEITQLFGHTAHFAEGALNGLAKAQTLQPDLVLLDLMMPELNGWQVYQRLRDFSSVPVIFITSDDTTANRAKADQLGAVLVNKDIRPQQLKEKIDCALAS